MLNAEMQNNVCIILSRYKNVRHRSRTDRYGGDEPKILLR